LEIGGGAAKAAIWRIFSQQIIFRQKTGKTNFTPATSKAFGN
jgi:hypothetical protein